MAASLQFDRGTVILRGVGDLARDLPGVLWDERVGAWRAPAFRRPALVDALSARGVSVEPGGGATALTGTWARFDLRPYQAAALEAWLVGGRRGLIVLPTGAGKTRVALAALAHSGLSALVLTPTIALLDQWRAQLTAAYSGPIGQIGDGARRVEPLCVATFEGAYRRMETIGDRFELLVVDEVHHFGAGVRAEALEMSIAARRLGLTATAPTDDAQQRRLDQLVGPIVAHRSVADLSGEYLAPLTRVTVAVELTPDERFAYAARHRVYEDFAGEARRRIPRADYRELVRFGMKSEAGRRALRAWRELRAILAYCTEKRAALGRLLARHADARVLVFCADNQAAYAIAREHLLMPITCDIGADERAAAFARFARGELRGLVSARVLNEGIDLPSADVAIVVSAALGEREHVQRVGRVLRPGEGKEALLYELVAANTLELGWARRRSRGLDPRGHVRVRAARTSDHPALARTW